MHSARILATAAFVMTSMLAAPSSQAQTCDPTTFATSCNGDDLTYCSTATPVDGGITPPNEEAVVSCTTGIWTDGAAVCGESGCVGSDCATAVTPFCVGGDGQRCIGFSGGLADPPAPFNFLCDDGFSCVTGVVGNAIGGTCQTRQGDACALAETNKGCVSNIATTCLSFANIEGTLTDWVGTDCTAFGATCALNANNAPVCKAAEGAQCFPELNVGCAAGLTCGATRVCEAGTPPLGQEGDACDAQSPCDTGLFCNSIGLCEVEVGACGNVTLKGECNGDVLSYCSDEQLVTRDCTTQYPDNPASCGLVNAEWGFDCLVDDDATCRYVSGPDETPFYAFCNEGSGCTFTEDGTGFFCEAGVGTCVPPAQGQPFVPVCNGIDKLTIACNVDQPYGISCPASSTCSNGACNGVSVGGWCADGIVNCDTGLTCDAATGTCIDPANPPADGGSPPPADGGGSPPADGGSPPLDGGSPPPADGGSPPPAVDGGGPPPPVDGGGPPPVDGGADAGTAEPDPQPTLEPTQEPSDDPPEEPPAECSHVSTSAQSSGFSGLFAMMLLGLAIRRRRN
ncbi:MAG: hypothetical protein GY822_30595 [Deltaproteobacteria bacterium]|nr:hypothetical protein [Deltaproteobacteria bacterium]